MGNYAIMGRRRSQMPLDYTFSCPLPNGVHARPAAAIEEVARRFASAIWIENTRTGRSANAKSVLGLVGLDIRAGDSCRLAVEGRDEREALASLSAFFEDVFPRYDEPLPAPDAPAPAVVLPRALAEAGAEVLPGTAVVPGIGTGRAVRVGALSVPLDIPLEGIADPRAEIERTQRALDRLAARLDTSLARARPGIEADLLRAHRSVAKDPEFTRHLETAIGTRHMTAAGAIASAERTFTALLAATGSALLRERALDIRDVCIELLREVYGLPPAGAGVRLDTDAVCLADELTPGQFIALDPRRLKGLVLARGGQTSHTVILARSRAVPTLVGVAGLAAEDLEGREVVVDADLGVLVTRVPAGVRRYYELESRRLAGRARRERHFAERPGVTSDNQRVEIAANIALPDEAAAAFDSGAEGIGLFRTEMLFVDREAPPDEDEQVEAYRRALDAARGRPVIIRTLDVGGDKPLAYLRLPRENNPFLGYRGVRMYPEFEPLFRTQVRALLRASAFGPLKVMVPMVSRVEEAAWTRGIIADEQARLGEQGVASASALSVGAMIEVPSAAFLLGRLARHLDFFSIGTNDLLQYFTAVDRSNGRLGSLYTTSSPAFLGLLGKIVDDAHAQGRWVGMCGEMAGDPRYLPLLVGLGLDEMSMAPQRIPAAKAEVSTLSAADARALLRRAVEAATAAEVEALLDAAACTLRAPLLTPEMVSGHAFAQTQAEAIKEAVDRLYASGRTDRPRDVESAVWRREESRTTHLLADGTALLHCRTDAVRADALVVLRLPRDVRWGVSRSGFVRTVVLLAARECETSSSEHRLLDALSRHLMDEEFVGRLEREEDGQALCAFIARAIGVEEPAAHTHR